MMIGLFTGTIVLVVFVRGIISTLHGFGLGDTAQSRVLIGVMCAFIVASFLLTRSVVKRLYRTQSATVRRVALGALVVPGALSMWAWSNPTMLLAKIAGSESSSLAMRGGPEFIFGPYPDADRLAELKKQGVTTIISLQHPSVVVEMQGIRDEKENTAKLGLELIHAPMLPWVSDNEASLDKIREIARTGHGKYYVHCGLGRDRVNVVKRVIESMSDNRNIQLAKAKDIRAAKGLEQRTEPFQNGRLFQLRPGVWLVPIPNKMELSDILFGAEGRVLLVLDPRDSVQQAWSRTAQQQLKSYVIPFAVVPFDERDAADDERIALLANRIQSEPGRVTVIVPRTPFGSGTNERQTRVATALLRRFGVSWALTPAERASQRSSSQSAGSSGR
ncbi:MAG TPA: hypothetical protein VJ867_02025 [Gemmatimonadaceae bacterium]|nr:hypothetical protein [Gemmatimonadaceae bacterium]